MREHLHPMSLGEVLDWTFQIYRSRFLVFVGLAAFPPFAMGILVASNVLWWRVLPDGYGPKALLWFTSQGLLYWLALANVSTLFHLAIWPAIANATAKTSLGERCGIATELRACFARWRSWLGLTLANWFGVLILPELTVGGALVGVALLMYEVLKMDPNDPLRLGPKMFGASVVIGWVVFQCAIAYFSLSVPVWTLENSGIGASLRRAWRLSKGTRWRIGFTGVAATCLKEIFYLSLTISLLFALNLIFGHSTIWWSMHITARHFVQLAGVLTGVTAAALIGPVFPIALTLFYYDQRMRREGSDIEKLMNAAGWIATETGAAEAIAVAPAQAEGAQG